MSNNPPCQIPKSKTKHRPPPLPLHNHHEEDEEESLLSSSSRSSSRRGSVGATGTGSSGGGLAYLISKRRSSLMGQIQQSQQQQGQQGGTGSEESSPSIRYHQRRRQSGNFLELPVVHFGSRHHRQNRSPSPSHRQHRIGSLPVSASSGNSSTTSSTATCRSRNFTSYDDYDGGGGGGSSSDDGDDESSVVVSPTTLMYRLRTFNIKDNRVVNTGDEVVPRGRHTRGASNNSSRRTSPLNTSTPSTCCTSHASMESIYSQFSDVSSSGELDNSSPERFRVVMLGHSGVGKSSLVSQFMTSDYINTYDASLDDEFGERSVSVLLDEEESELVFIDHPCAEMSPENSMATYNPHAVIVTYSITDRHSFAVAEEILRYLHSYYNGFNTAIILAGNKCDLERAREVDVGEGKSLATSFSAKFIETSPGLQHNTDELLVGTLKQCRLRKNFHHQGPNNKKKKKKKKRSHRRGNKGGIFSIHELAWELMKKIMTSGGRGDGGNHQGVEQDLHGNIIKSSRSCVNLHVL